MLRNRKAQAVLELAILGALIITAFAILIKYSEQYNREQSYMQQTFRANLRKAKEVNDSVDWTTTDFRRMPNVTNPVEIGGLQQFGSSNSVLWSDGKEVGGVATEPKAYFQLNRAQPYSEEIPMQAGGAVPGQLIITDSYHTSTLNSTTNFGKTESSGNIHTQKSLGAGDSIVGSAIVGGTSVSLNSELGGGGVYTGGGLGRATKDTQ